MDTHLFMLDTEMRPFNFKVLDLLKGQECTNLLTDTFAQQCCVWKI